MRGIRFVAISLLMFVTAGLCFVGCTDGNNNGKGGENIDSSLLGVYEFENMVFYSGDEIVDELDAEKAALYGYTSSQIKFVVTSGELIAVYKLPQYVAPKEEKRVSYSLDGAKLVLGGGMNLLGIPEFDFVTAENGKLVLDHSGETGSTKISYYKKTYGVSDAVAAGSYRFEELIIKDQSGDVIFQTQTEMTLEQVQRYGLNTTMYLVLDGLEMSLHYASTDAVINSYIYNASDGIITILWYDGDEILITYDEDRIYMQAERTNDEGVKEVLHLTFTLEV